MLLSFASGITEAGLVAEELRPGDPRWIGPYRLTGRLGAGGMGEVFLGRSAGGWAVAVKVIRPDLAADQEFRVRFRREVAAARSVSGLYTAAVADADTTGPVPWLATAYVPGPSLARAVDLHGPLPAGSVLALAAGLAEGLTAIHRAGLVHRDLKPSNVLLAADGPRIIDFGIARDAEWTILTNAGQVVGSPDYMSPEQASGQQIGSQSDVFSLGGVLTFAASGQPPFRGQVTAALLTSIVQDQPDLRLVPPDLRPLIAGCLAKDPARRPTPTRLLTQLGEHPELSSGWLPEHLLAGSQGATVRPPSPAQPPAKSQSPGRSGAGDTGPPDGATQTVVTPPTGERRQGRPASPPAAAPPSAQTPVAPPPGPPDPVPRSARDAGSALIPPAGRATVQPPAVAAAGLGGWLAIDGPFAGGGKHSGGPSSPTSGTAAPLPHPRSPYRLTVTGAHELSCTNPDALHSMEGGHPIQVVFANHSRATVHVIWLTAEGREHAEGTLPPGSLSRVQAYSGDAWELADATGCIAAYDTTGASSITVTKS
jgi:serine/threonine protein kinase